jgi:hypothetical protein
VDWFDVFLHVLLDLILIDILKSTIFSIILSLSFTCPSPFVLYDHISTKFASCLAFLTGWNTLFRIELVIAINSLALHFHGIELLLMVAVDVEHIDNRVGAAHEVRMIRVDIAVLNFDQVPDHYICRGELLR